MERTQPLLILQASFHQPKLQLVSGVSIKLLKNFSTNSSLHLDVYKSLSTCIK